METIRIIGIVIFVIAILLLFGTSLWKEKIRHDAIIKIHKFNNMTDEEKKEYLNKENQ